MDDNEELNNMIVEKSRENNNNYLNFSKVIIKGQERPLKNNIKGLLRPSPRSTSVRCNNMEINTDEHQIDYNYLIEIGAIEK